MKPREHVRSDAGKPAALGGYSIMAIRRPRRNSRLNRRPYTAGSSSGESILGAPDTTDLGDWSDGSDSGSSSSGSTYDGGSSSYDSGSSSSSSSGGSDYGSF